MASISNYSHNYNGELARINQELLRELQLSDILKSEELETCEFISEVATVYLEVIKNFKMLPFTELQVKIKDADELILTNILVDRENLMVARDSYIKEGKVVPLDKAKIPELLEEHRQATLPFLNNVRRSFEIHEGMDFDAFELKLQKLIDQQIELWGELEDQKTPTTMRIHSLNAKKSALQEKRAQEENGESEETLYSAARAGSLERIQELIRKFWGFTGGQANFINTPASDGSLALHLAAFYGHHEVVQLLLEKKAQVDALDGAGRQAIHWAAKGGHTLVLNVLLNKNVSINAKDTYGRTPLHYATYNGLKVMTQFLLGKGADVNSQAEGEDNTTPLHEAVMNERTTIVSDLTKIRSLDVNLVDSRRHSAIYYAAQIGNSQILALLTTHESWRAPKDKGNPNHPESLLLLTPDSNAARVKSILEKLQYVKTN